MTTRRSQRLQSQNTSPSPFKAVHLRNQGTQTPPLRHTTVFTQTPSRRSWPQPSATSCDRSSRSNTPRSEPRPSLSPRYRSSTSTPSKKVLESVLTHRDRQGTGRNFREASSPPKSTPNFSKKRRTVSWGSFTEPRRLSYDRKSSDLSISGRERSEVLDAKKSSMPSGSNSSASNAVSSHISFVRNSRSAQMLVAALRIHSAAEASMGGNLTSSDDSPGKKRKLLSGITKRVTFK